MNEKKTRDANLDRFRMPLLFLGLLFSSAFVLTAFEWKTYAELPTTLETEMDWRDLPDETIFTAVVMKKPPPPPPAQKPVVDVMTLIDDDPIKHDLIIPDIDPLDDPVIEEIVKVHEFVPEETFDAYRVSVLPDFPGGDSARREFLGQNVHYPTKAIRAGKQGTVWVEFVVGKDGKIEDAHIIRGIDEECDAEALRVVKQMPEWTPGKQNGLPVRVRFQMPITFTLKNY